MYKQIDKIINEKLDNLICSYKIVPIKDMNALCIIFYINESQKLMFNLLGIDLYFYMKDDIENIVINKYQRIYCDYKLIKD